MLDQRGRLLFAALGFVGLRDAPADPALDRLHTWLDSWSGIGHVVAGMSRQGYRLHLTNIDAATWRATFSGDVMSAAEGFGADQTGLGRGAAGGVGGAGSRSQGITRRLTLAASSEYLRADNCAGSGNHRSVHPLNPGADVHGVGGVDEDRGRTRDDAP